MDKKYFEELLSIDLKIPSKKDSKKAIKHHPLTPHEFLEFLETGRKLTPDFASYIKARLKKTPCNVRFKL